MNVEIKEIQNEMQKEAIEIFTESFMDDPLFMLTFSEENERKKITKIMYEFVVEDMVPALNLKLIGAFIEDKLAGCTVYRTPESFEWDEKMNDALDKMRGKAGNDRINLIGEYATLICYQPDVEYFYGNELAVKKEYRKMGIGKLLSDFMVNECKKHPIAKGLLIDTANENNVRLYEKWGWELKAACNFYSIKKYFLWKDKSKIITKNF